MTGADMLAETVDGRWRPGIGDPTLMGWLTVAAYLVAVICCFLAWRNGVVRRQGEFFWLGMTILMAFLGVNKQLDLQSLVTQIGRDVLTAQGAYAYRRTYQLAFIGVVTAVCVLMIPIALWLIRKNLQEQWPALVGIIFLLGFIVIRACSFHHVDVFLGARIGGMKWNWIFELGGILLITWGAARTTGRYQLRPRQNQ